MKKIICLLLILIASVSLCSCGKNNIAAATVDTNKLVAYELEKVENINNLDDETIKALSVIIRTNILNGDDVSLTEDNVNEKLYNLALSTDGITLVSENSEKINNIEHFFGDDNYIWKKEIKKTELLKFLSKNNISIANLSKLDINKNDDGTLSSISIGGKNFEYDMLKNEFDLNSNNIYNITNNRFSIVIEGKGYKFDDKFDLNKSKKLAKNGKNYKNILNELLPKYNILEN